MLRLLSLLLGSEVLVDARLRGGGNDVAVCRDVVGTPEKRLSRGDEGNCGMLVTDCKLLPFPPIRGDSGHTSACELTSARPESDDRLLSQVQRAS